MYFQHVITYKNNKYKHIQRDYNVRHDICLAVLLSHLFSFSVLEDFHADFVSSIITWAFGGIHDKGNTDISISESLLHLKEMIRFVSNLTVLILINTLWLYFTIAYSLNIRLFVYANITCIYLYYYKHTSYTNRLCWYVFLLLLPIPKLLIFTIIL